jgi:hypothetical protein
MRTARLAGGTGIDKARRAYLIVATTILSRESRFPMLAAGDEAGYVFERGKAVDSTAEARDLYRCAESLVGKGDATRRESTI